MTMSYTAICICVLLVYILRTHQEQQQQPHHDHSIQAHLFLWQIFRASQMLLKHLYSSAKYHPRMHNRQDHTLITALGHGARSQWPIFTFYNLVKSSSVRRRTELSRRLANRRQTEQLSSSERARYVCVTMTEKWGWKMELARCKDGRGSF